MRALEHRVPPPVLALLVAAAMGLTARATPPVAAPWPVRAALAALIALAAARIAVPAMGALRRAGTTVDPMRIEGASVLVTAGVYRLTRNPMYLGLALLLTAWAVWLARPWPLLGPVVFVLAITRLQIIPEERALATRFGAAYAAYRAEVRRWL